MITQQTQIKINLPLQLKEFIESKASRLGLPLAGYIKYLMIRDIEDIRYPIYPVSERVEKKAVKALKEINKSVKVDNVRDFFKAL